jgi:hypothetical protein
MPPPFDLKGVRAPKQYIDDQVQQHQREEDQVMAQAYGFKYESEKNSIGCQNPDEQRLELSENRLRDRKLTQKATDAAEEVVVIEGKRTRKPRIIDNQSNQRGRRRSGQGPIGGVRSRQGQGKGRGHGH